MKKSNNIWLVLALIGVLIFVSNQLGIVPTDCKDVNPSLLTYYVTVPASGADYIGGTTHYGIQYVANSIVEMQGSPLFCGNRNVMLCPIGTIATVGAEAKGQTWGTTIPCVSGMYCIDQSRPYDAWGCVPGDTQYRYAACSYACIPGGSGMYAPACNPDTSATPIGCKDTTFTLGELGVSTQEEYYNSAAYDPFRALRCTWSGGFADFPKYRICKYSTGIVCPSEKTISYGCKPDPNYVAPTPCPASWRNFCNGNDLRKSDGCGQDNLIETCQYGCNAESASCNAAPVVATCAWAGMTCVEGNVYRYDTVCDRQELAKTCQYGCLNGQCTPAPSVTPTPTPTSTAAPIATSIPGYMPTQTPIQPTPDNPEAKSLNMNIVLLVFGVGGIALWFLFGNQK